MVLSRGDVTLLGEAYAFGVAWSFAMKALAVTVLRFTRPDADRWRVPLKLRVGGTEWPVGLMLVTALLFLLAGVNLLTKEAATIGGDTFTAAFFILLTVSERRIGGAGRRSGRAPEHFRLEQREGLSPASLGVAVGGIVVGVHDPNRLAHLDALLSRGDRSDRDVVLVAVKADTSKDGMAVDAGAAEAFGGWENRVFTTAVASAGDAGRPVAMMSLRGDSYGGVLEAALCVEAPKVVFGLSKRGLDWQRDRIERGWGELGQGRGSLHVEILPEDGGEPTHLDLRDDGKHR